MKTKPKAKKGSGLKPCPWCGVIPKIARSGNGWVVECANEKCNMIPGNFCRDKGDVIKAWNTRAEPKQKAGGKRSTWEGTGTLLLYKGAIAFGTAPRLYPDGDKAAKRAVDDYNDEPDPGFKMRLVRVVATLEEVE